jgi:hypothetical protein
MPSVATLSAPKAFLRPLEVGGPTTVPYGFVSGC